MRKEVITIAAIAISWVAARGAGAATREQPCHVDGVETPATCVTLDVPRDYDRPDGATLALTAVVIHASTARPAPDPLIVLAGGPGQSATSLGGWLAPVLERVRRERDVVLLDARGTGLSEPLDCKISFSSVIAGGAARPPASLAAMRTAAQDCAHALGDRVLHHSSREVIEDIERLRAALGAERIDLWGGSYGTRIAQHYVRAYGERVRAVVLDAVSPVATSVLVTGAHTPDAALGKLFAECAADSACAATFPDLPAQLARLLAAAREAPLEGPAADPVTGERGTALLDYVTLANTIRVALYGRVSTELLPFAIDAAVRGNLAPLLGIGGAVATDASVAFGAQFSMLCAEEWPVATAAGAAARTGELMRDGYYEMFNQACEVWPSEPLPTSMLAPFSSRVPALAVSGDSDPVTPPALAEQALAQFATAVHVIVPHGFHTNSGNACVARIIASFLADPLAGGRDHGCVAATPPLAFNTGPSS